MGIIKKNSQLSPVSALWATYRLTALLIVTYTLLFYLVFTHQYRLDFSPFYSASQAFFQGDNPYQVLFTSYFPTVKKLSVNLNPPFVLCLFRPLSILPYDMAVVIWSVLSFVSGLIGAGIAFYYAFPALRHQRHYFIFYVLYLTSYATLMNAIIAQVGTWILFFAMAGYHFYKTNRDGRAGVLWGLLIAIKLFPGLLFFYVLIERRYRVFIIMLTCVLLFSMLPLLIDSFAIYSHYFSMLSRVLWYGDSWNASLYGYIFRLVVDGKQHVLTAKIIYVPCFFAVMAGYIRSLLFFQTSTHIVSEHQGFCLTLVCMLLLSPFGWLYYFPLLTFPLAVLWVHMLTQQRLYIWLTAWFFINFPMDYVRATHMTSVLSKLGIYSFHFYGLILLLYLIMTMHYPHKKTTPSQRLQSDVTKILPAMVSFALLMVYINMGAHLIA
jgi:alpha-1,2-mannosyltransferase